MISAKDAKALSITYISEKVVIDELDRKIINAVLLGKTAIQTDKLSPLTKTFLGLHGYRVTANEQAIGNGNAYTISWETEQR